MTFGVKNDVIYFGANFESEHREFFFSMLEAAVGAIDGIDFTMVVGGISPLMKLLTTVNYPW